MNKKYMMLAMLLCVVAGSGIECYWETEEETIERVGNCARALAITQHAIFIEKVVINEALIALHAQQKKDLLAATGDYLIYEKKRKEALDELIAERAERVQA